MVRSLTLVILGAFRTDVQLVHADTVILGISLSNAVMLLDSQALVLQMFPSSLTSSGLIWDFLYLSKI